jgi:hypothetical protein
MTHGSWGHGFAHGHTGFGGHGGFAGHGGLAGHAGIGSGFHGGVAVMAVGHSGVLQPGAWYETDAARETGSGGVPPDPLALGKTRSLPNAPVCVRAMVVSIDATKASRRDAPSRKQRAARPGIWATGDSLCSREIRWVIFHFSLSVAPLPLLGDIARDRAE